MGTIIGLAGTYMGAKTGAALGSGITSFLPKNMQKFTSATAGAFGGIVAGATGYFVAKEALTNLQVSSNISETDKKESYRIGEQLIKAQLLTDEQLVSMYKEHFETFIKAKYKTFDMEVLNIEYKNSKGVK